MYLNSKHKIIAESRNHTYIGTYNKYDRMITYNKVLGIDLDKNRRKAYMRVKCNYCGYEHDVALTKFKKSKKKSGCEKCCGELKNSVYYSSPNIKIFNKNKEEVNTKFIYRNSSHKYYIKCPDCGLISSKPKLIRNFSCEYCSDGLSIPEKFMINILHQLNIKYEYQVTNKQFNWCENYRYDFYIYSIDAIIETHGKQHYEECSLSNRNLSEEQLNDYNKYNLAKNHINNYIVIDCRCSEFEFLKRNVIEALDKYFDLNTINWELAWENSQNSKVIEVWELWNNGYDNINVISDKIGLCRDTISRYIRFGSKCGKIKNYNKNNQMKKCNKYVERKVIRVNDGKIFRSAKNASDICNIDSSSILKCCKGKRKSAGKFNNEKAIWRYYDD